MFSGKNKKKPRKNRQTKQVLVFDEKARIEFLTGFQKRKDERRKLGHAQAERKLKEEKKRILQKRRELMNKRVKHQYLPPDLEQLATAEVQELPEHTVTITDISQVDLAGQGGLHLGQNSFQQEEDKEKDEQDDVPQKKKEKILREMNQKLQQKAAKHLKKATTGKSKSRSSGRAGKKRMRSKKQKHKRKAPH